MWSLLLRTSIVLLLMLIGCEKKPDKQEEFDSVSYVLNERLKHPSSPIVVRQRAELAMSKWKNGIVDSKPILIEAYMLKAEGIEQIDLALTILDEDRDVIGFAIKEKPFSSNATPMILVEEYPAYIHCLPFTICDIHLVPIHIRVAHQQKDVKLWDKYLGIDYEGLFKEYERKHTLSDDIVYPEVFWEETFPPVWVSLPVPNKIDVSIWVYDKDGNKSEPVKLLNFLDKQE